LDYVLEKTRDVHTLEEHDGVAVAAVDDVVLGIEVDVVVFGNEGVEVADLDDPDTEEVVAADTGDAI
jgi:3D (Asp-Asp-Asp) domain-containing protein